jgi:drug/metabolite transporter (DMT)-like permease
VASAPPAIHTAFRPLTLTTAGLTLLTVMLWGGNPVATRYSIDALPPITVAGLRFLLATVWMLGWCWAEGVSFRITRPQWKPIFITGTLLFLQITTFTIGAAWTSSSHASLYVNTFVFWVVGLEHFVTKGDRLSAEKSAGLLLAAGAVLLLILSTSPSADVQRDPPSLAGDSLLIFSAFLLGVKFLYTKSALKVIAPTELIFWHDVVAVAQFFIAAAICESPDFSRMTWPAALGLAYQGFLVGGLCFGLQAHLLRHHSASQIAVFSFATPLVGMVLGTTLRGDQLSVWLLAAGLAIAAGIYLVNRAR